VNDPPAVASGTVALPEDTTATLTFTFQDPDADPLRWEILNPPLHGTLTGTGPDYTYAPEPHYHGPDHFTVCVTDPAGATAHGGAAITIIPVNDPPVPDTLTVSTLEEQPVPVDLTATDPDGDPLTFTLLTAPTSGQLSGQAPHLLYAPDPDFFGQDTLLFSVTDGQETHIATVFIATAPVNDPPIAATGTLATLEDTPATLHLGPLATDIDDLPAALTFTLLSPPQHGQLSGSGSTLTFTPSANWHGTDTLTWRVTDAGGLNADAAFTITVSPVNDPPSVTAGDPHSLTLPAFAALTASASDDGDPPGQPSLTFSWTQLSGPGAAVFAAPDQPDTAAAFTAAGEYVLRITVTDGEFTAHDELTVTVIPANQAPAISIAPATAILRGEPLTLTGFVSDDGLPTGSGVVTLWSASGPGTAHFSSVAALTTSAIFDTAGAWTVTLRATDGEILSHAGLHVTVVEPNHAPVVTAGPLLTYEIGQPPAALTGTITDDGQPRGAAVTSLWSQSSGPAPASIASPSSLSSTVQFTAPGDYQFRLTASDTLLSGSAVQSVHVIPRQNRAPTVDAGADQVLEGQAFAQLSGTAQDDGLPAGSAVTASWSQVSGPAPAVIQSTETLTTGVTGPAPGHYVFRLTAGDGELTAHDDVTVSFVFVSQSPSVNAGPDQSPAGFRAMLNGAVVDGQPLAGPFTMQWTASPPLTFSNPTNPLTNATAVLAGAYSVTLTATSATGEFFSDSAILNFGGLNEPPSVQAGEDVAINLGSNSAPNLLLNPSAETLLTGGVPANWTVVTGVWDSTWYNVGSNGFTTRHGTRAFTPGIGRNFELRQDVSLAAYAAAIAAGSAGFSFTGYQRSEPGDSFVDDGRIILESLNAAGAVLSTTTVEPWLAMPETWLLQAAYLTPPPDTVTVRVRLLVENLVPQSWYDNLAGRRPGLWFDHLALRPADCAEVELHGLISDDGLPQSGVLSAAWTQQDGPAGAEILTPFSAESRIRFWGPGTWDFRLTATDGELASHDTVQVTVARDGGVVPVLVDAGPDRTVDFPDNSLGLTATASGGAGSLECSWIQLDGPAVATIQPANSLSPVAAFPASGRYTLRLYATDGTSLAFDDVSIEVQSAARTQPLDITVVFDKSGSMALPAGNPPINYGTAAALEIVADLNAFLDRSALVSFNTTASLDAALTFNQQTVTHAVQNLPVGGGSYLHLGIAAARQHLIANGRPEAIPVILVISDGDAEFYNQIVAEANAAINQGIRIISLGLGIEQSDRNLRAISSSAADYHRATDSTTAKAAVQRIAEVLCNAGQSFKVFAGADQPSAQSGLSIPLSARIEALGASSSAVITTQWTTVHGPASAVFADAASAVTDVTLPQSGWYLLRLTATLTDGSLTLTAADEISLRADTVCNLSPPPGLVGWWRLDGGSEETFTGLTANTIFGWPAPEYGPGMVGGGVTLTGQELRWPEQSAWNVATSDTGWTLEFWADISPGFSGPVFNWKRSSGQGAEFMFFSTTTSTRSAYFRPADTGSVGGGAFTAAPGWHHYAVVYNRAGSAMVTEDGVLKASGNVPVISRAEGRLTFGWPHSSSAVRFDEVSLYNRPLTLGEIAAIYSEGATGKRPPQENSAPVVSAGADIVQPSLAIPVPLSGSVSDDGLPPGAPLTTVWSQVSGPGTAQFTDAASLTTTVAFSDPGIYTLRLRVDDTFSAGSDFVTVHAGLSPLPVPSGLRAWWPLNDSPSEFLSGAPVTPPLLTYGPGKVGNALAATLQAGSLGMLAASGANLVIPATPGSFSVEGWLNLRNDQSQLWAWNSSNEFRYGHSVPGELILRLGGVTAYTRRTIAKGVWSHLAVTFEGTTRTAVFYVDGFPIYSTTMASAVPATSTTFNFARIWDELCLYDRALSAAEIQSVFSAGAAGKARAGANAAPVVAVEPLSAAITGQPLEILGFATDDQLPAGAALSPSWSIHSGPGGAVFSSAQAFSGAVTFSFPGTYVLQLAVSDSSLVGTAQTSVTVHDPPNSPPVVNAGPDLVTALQDSAPLAPQISDDGLPRGVGLSGEWSLVSGPGAVTFNGDPYPSPSASFSAPGLYVLRLTASDSELSDSDDIQITVTGAPPDNTPPALDAGPDRTIPAGSPLTMLPQITDDGLPRSWLSVTWRVLSGGPHAALQSASGGGLTAVFHRTGNYTLEVSVFDGEFTTTDSLVVAVTPVATDPPVVTLTAPAAGSEFEFGQGIVLSASASDPDANGGIATIQFLADGQPVSAPLPADGQGSAAFVWSGASEGGQSLSAVAVDFSGTSAESAAAAVSVTPSRPRLEWQHPRQHGVFQSDDAVTLRVEAQPGAAGAAVVSVEFLARAPGQSIPVSAGTDAAAPWEWSWTAPAAEGAWELTAVATDAAGMVHSESITVHVSADLSVPPVLSILSPADAATITAPVSITGTVSGVTLQSYMLQLRPVLPDNGGLWRTLATGAAGITESTLGTLDPTLLENGPYELRLMAEQWDGGTVTAEPVFVLLDGNMKIGHFAVAFEDLSVPMPGLNVTVTRSYDSRRTDRADFGVGWDLAVSSMRVVKNRPVGQGYMLQSAGLAEISQVAGQSIHLWTARAPLRKMVTLALPDGTALAFKPRLEVHPGVRMYSPEPDCSIVPQNQVKVVFTPVGKTQGTLEPIDPPDAIAFPQLNDGPYGPGAGQPGVCRLEGGVLSKGMPGFDPSYEPVRFKYTSPEGAVFMVAEAKGVESVQDRNGNRLTFTPEAITHSSGLSITFTRDSAGRIAAITDPAGAQLLYSYDAQGRLTQFTDRTGGVTEYRYTHAAFPFYLTEIIDPAGNRAVKSLYDDSGRLIGQEDPDGHAVTMEHDVAAYKETVTDRLGHATVHEYDANGNVVKTTDALGGITLRTYDDRDRELTVTNPLGHTTTKTYDARDNILTETNALGETTTYTYNANNQPLTITDPRGHVTAFTYDANGNTTAMTDPTGLATTFTFDTKGSVTSLTMPGGTAYEFTLDGLTGEKLSQTVRRPNGAIAAHQTFTYNTNGEQTGVTDYLVPSGATDTAAAVPVRRTEHGLDAAGRMTSMRMVDAAANLPIVTQSWTYNANGDELTYTDPLGRVTTTEYDSHGRDYRTLHPDGTTSVLVYNANGDIVSTTNRSGGVMSYVMDELGRQTRVNHVDGSFTTSTYDAAGREITKTDALGLTSTMTYDPAGRLLTLTDPAGNTSTYAYDASGQQIAATDADGHTTTTEYDAAGRPLRTTAPDGTFHEFAYDSAGRLMIETDPMGHTTHRDYDAQGRLVKVTDALGGVTRMEFDTLGRPQRIIDALGRITSYTTDAMGRRTSRTLPGGQSETMTWQNALQLASRTDFNGFTTTFTWDADGNLLEKSADPAHPSLMLPHAAAKVRYTYNQFNLPATAEVLNAAGSVIHAQSWSYDAHGRLMSATGPEGTITYTRDAQDRITSTRSATPEGYHAAYAYDDAGRVATVTSHRGAAPRTHTFAWTASGALESSHAAAGLTHQYTRDALQRVTGLSITSAAGALETFTHTYNAASRRTGTSEASGRSIAYNYDALHRLTEEQIAATGSPAPGSLPITPGALGYTFDAVGNRLARASTLTAPAPAAQNFTYNANDELTGTTCDLNGNPTAGTADLLAPALGTGGVAVPAVVGTNDVYDFEDRLLRRTRSDGVTVDLHYDATGNRVAKSVTHPGQPGEVTRYLIDSHAPNGWPQAVEEHAALNAQSSTLNRVTHYGPHGPISQWSPTHGEQDFVRDAHGSLRALVDAATGEVTAAADYDAYGIPLATTGTAASPLGYNGEHYDPDLGLIYLRARFYDPSTGRFLNRDPYQGMMDDPQSLHAYHFAHLDPVNLNDPSGNFSLLDTLITNNLIKLQNFVRQYVRSTDTSGAALKEIGSLIIIINYAATVQSAVSNMFQFGSFHQWLALDAALLWNFAYQFSERKEFIDTVDNAVSSGNLVTISKRTLALANYTAGAIQLKNEAERDGIFSNRKMNGYPEFTPYTAGIIGTVPIKLTGTHNDDVKAARSRMVWAPNDREINWHHHEVLGLMQAVKRPFHANSDFGKGHWGGRAIYRMVHGSGYDRSATQ
jgi:RHS repeat-associated protein